MLVNPLKNTAHRMKLLQSNNRHAMKKTAPRGGFSLFSLPTAHRFQTAACLRQAGLGA
jgi:hypothetical protein